MAVIWSFGDGRQTLDVPYAMGMRVPNRDLEIVGLCNCSLRGDVWLHSSTSSPTQQSDSVKLQGRSYHLSAQIPPRASHLNQTEQTQIFSDIQGPTNLASAAPLTSGPTCLSLYTWKALPQISVNLFSYLLQVFMLMSPSWRGLSWPLYPKPQVPHQHFPSPSPLLTYSMFYLLTCSLSVSPQ